MSWQAAFLGQAESCATLGSPFTAGLLRLLADRGLPEGPVRDRIIAWPGDITSRGASVPLRLAGALHGLVLEGRAPALAAIYPPAGPVDDDLLYRCASAAIDAEPGWISDRINLPPQTNEVGRSAALIAAASWLSALSGLPMKLSELGASAGLNLLFDHYALKAEDRHFGANHAVLTLTPDWCGSAPPQAPLTILDRAGADLSPIDPVHDRLRLMSYIWPDQSARLARTRAALDLAALHPPDVACIDAADFLAARLTDPQDGVLHMVFHTIAWQYFPPRTQQHGLDLLTAAGTRATPDRPLARIAMEADGNPDGAGLTATLWPGGDTHVLGRADFHGRWINWQAPRPENAKW
jgi:hypothetical protein